MTIFPRPSSVLYVIALIAMVAAAFAVLGDGSPARGLDSFERQANCIAEFDYQHADGSKFDNLVAALQECQP